MTRPAPVSASFTYTVSGSEMIVAITEPVRRIVLAPASLFDGAPLERWSDIVRGMIAVTDPSAL